MQLLKKEKETKSGKIAYSKEDVGILKTMLTWKNGDATYPKDWWSTQITINNSRIWVYMFEILNHLRKRVRLLSPVLSCSLESVPLYINSDPELSKWRLFVGK